MAVNFCVYRYACHEAASPHNVETANYFLQVIQLLAEKPHAVFLAAAIDFYQKAI